MLCYGVKAGGGIIILGRFSQFVGKMGLYLEKGKDGGRRVKNK